MSTRRGGSNEYQQSMIWIQNKKQNIPLHTPILLYKSGVLGGIYGHPNVVDNFLFLESTSDAQAKAVTASPSGTNYRNGELTPDRAYNGTHGRLFYHTPSDFFSSSKAVGFDKADTAKGKHYMTRADASEDK